MISIEHEHDPEPSLLEPPVPLDFPLSLIDPEGSGYGLSRSRSAVADMQLLR